MEATTNHKTPVDKGQSVWPHLFEPFRNAAASVANFFSPSADAANAEDAYEINMELPGVAPEDIDVSLHDPVLTIKGEKKYPRRNNEILLFHRTQLRCLSAVLSPAGRCGCERYRRRLQRRRPDPHLAKNVASQV